MLRTRTAVDLDCHPFLPCWAERRGAFVVIVPGVCRFNDNERAAGTVRRRVVDLLPSPVASSSTTHASTGYPYGRQVDREGWIEAFARPDREAIYACLATGRVVTLRLARDDRRRTIPVGRRGIFPCFLRRGFGPFYNVNLAVEGPGDSMRHHAFA